MFPHCQYVTVAVILFSLGVKATGKTKAEYLSAAVIALSATNWPNAL